MGHADEAASSRAQPQQIRRGFHSDESSTLNSGLFKLHTLRRTQRATERARPYVTVHLVTLMTKVT